MQAGKRVSRPHYYSPLPLTGGRVQLLLVICVLVVAVALHLVAMPYHHLYTNNLELVSLVVLLATLYFSLYFSLR